MLPPQNSASEAGSKHRLGGPTSMSTHTDGMLKPPLNSLQLLVVAAHRTQHHAA